MHPVVLARSGDPFSGAAFDRPCYRIPALAVTPSGRLLAAWDVRLDWRDLPGDFDLVLRHSDDGGLTWSEPRLLRGHEPGHGFGDASLLVDPDTGTVFCWYVGSTGRSFFSADAGPGAPGLELWLAASRDDGLTWTHRDLTGSLKPNDVSGMFAASGNGTVTATGRLLQPFVLRRDAEHFAAVAHSDDGGGTWTLGHLVGPDCDENKVLGLPDGSVLMHARATPRRRAARSADGVRFDDPQPDAALVDPACNGGLALVTPPDGSAPVLACTLCDDPAERRRLAVRTSDDLGQTWSDALVIDEGAAAYSVAVGLPDGGLAVAWEAGDYDEIVFARISADELGLAGSAPTLVARPGRPGAAKPPEVAG